MPATESEIVMVMTVVRNGNHAKDIADRLLDEGLAACVQELSPCKSRYVWKGKRETEEEIPLLVKCPADNAERVTSAIEAAHPYDVPEIIVIPVIGGLERYLDWVRSAKYTQSR